MISSSTVRENDFELFPSLTPKELEEAFLLEEGTQKFVSALVVEEPRRSSPLPTIVEEMGSKTKLRN